MADVADPMLATSFVVMVGVALRYVVLLERERKRAKAWVERAVRYWDRAIVAEGRVRVVEEELAEARADREALEDVLLLVCGDTSDGKVIPIDSARRRRVH